MPVAGTNQVARNVGGRPPRSSRQAVVDAGLEILRTQGLAAVTLGAVGERLGLHKVGLYTYVQSKDALLLAMRDEVNRRQLDALRDESHLAPDDALRAMCARLVDILTDYGQLIIAVEPDLTGPGLDIGEHFLDVLARLGLAPDQQLRVYALLAGYLLSAVTNTLPIELNGATQATDRARAELARTDPSRLPRLTALFLDAMPNGTPAPAELIQDVLSLVIDVLIPALRDAPTLQPPEPRR